MSFYNVVSESEESTVVSEYKSEEKRSDAYQSEEELEKALETIQYTVFNKHTIENEAQLKKELERIRKIGYAVDLEEEMAGVQCIAAPIFNQFNNIVATIWTSGPSGRLTKSIFPVVAKELILTANSISTSLGYTCKQ